MVISDKFAASSQVFYIVSHSLIDFPNHLTSLYIFLSLHFTPLLTSLPLAARRINEIKELETEAAISKNIQVQWVLSAVCVVYCDSIVDERTNMSTRQESIGYFPCNLLVIYLMMLYLNTHPHR